MKSDEERGERSQHAQVHLCGSLKICLMSLRLKSDKHTKKEKKSVFETHAKEKHSITKLLYSVGK